MYSSTLRKFVSTVPPPLFPHPVPMDPSQIRDRQETILSVCRYYGIHHNAGWCTRLLILEKLRISDLLHHLPTVGCEIQRVHDPFCAGTLAQTRSWLVSH